MTRLAARAEVQKLARTLGADATQLGFLDQLSAEALRDLRLSVYDRYAALDAALFQRVTRWFRPQVANPKILVPELVTAGYTTTQSDLYQLGLLMYQMHTGQPAIDVNASYEEITRQIAEGTPRQKAEALGTPLSQVIAKLLRRRDAYRYYCARDVWDDLRQLRWA